MSAANFTIPPPVNRSFSTGNLKTLAHADADVVRAFYEANYSADRMALAIASNASLDELEKHAREKFGPILNRSLDTIEREPIFLPRKEALRLATIEPVKEIRELWLEFVIPPTRPNFASKPDELLLSLINYPGKGGLIEALKEADLAHPSRRIHLDPHHRLRIPLPVRRPHASRRGKCAAGHGVVLRVSEPPARRTFSRGLLRRPSAHRIPARVL